MDEELVLDEEALPFNPIILEPAEEEEIVEEPQDEVIVISDDDSAIDVDLTIPEPAVRTRAMANRM